MILMGLIPSINRDVMALAERAVTALERIADAAEDRVEDQTVIAQLMAQVSEQ